MASTARRKKSGSGASKFALKSQLIHLLLPRSALLLSVIGLCFLRLLLRREALDLLPP